MIFSRQFDFSVCYIKSGILGYTTDVIFSKRVDTNSEASGFFHFSQSILFLLLQPALWETIFR